MDSDTLAVIVVLGILGVFAVLIYVMFVGQRRLKAKKEEIATMLGFHPIPPDAALQARIFQLHTHNRRRPAYELQYVFTRSSPDGQLYIYDLVSRDSEGYTVHESSAVALECPGWTLPRFSVYPRLDQPGRTASLANRMIAWLASRDMPAIPFDSSPDFEQKYLVTGEDAEGARRVLNDRVRGRLLGTPGLALEAGGDAFTLSVPHTRMRYSAEPIERTRSLVDIALAIAREMD